jgi:hypothetical protein
MEEVGMFTGLEGITDDRALIDTHQPAGLTDAAALLEVLKNGEGLVVGELGAIQGGALALGETLLAGTAGEDASLVRAGAKGDTEVVLAALAVVGAVGVLAAEKAEVVHGASSKRVHGYLSTHHRHYRILRTTWQASADTTQLSAAR